MKLRTGDRIRLRVRLMSGWRGYGTVVSVDPDGGVCFVKDGDDPTDWLARCFACAHEVGKCRHKEAIMNGSGRLFRAVFLPYCLERLSDGYYVVLNRSYTPIGLFGPAAGVSWPEYAGRIKIYGLSAAKAARMSWEGVPALDKIYLYSDSCTPTKDDACMSAYLERLAVLACLAIVPAHAEGFSKR